MRCNLMFEARERRGRDEGEEQDYRKETKRGQLGKRGEKERVKKRRKGDKRETPMCIHRERKEEREQEREQPKKKRDTWRH